jgi:hypothetical protein
MAILADLESTGGGRNPAGVLDDPAVEPATSQAALVKRRAHLSWVDVAAGVRNELASDGCCRSTATTSVTSAQDTRLGNSRPLHVERRTVKITLVSAIGG